MKDFKFSAERFLQIRKVTEKICEPLSTEDYVVQPIFDVSPPKWHLAHTTWFFEQFILLPYKNNYKVYNSDYNYIFNSYYEHHGERVMKAERGNLSRPTVEDVYKYREYVNKEIIDFFSYEQSRKLRFFLELGLHHEQQHQELMIYDIKYILGHNPLLPAYHKKHFSSVSSLSEWLPVEEGIYYAGHNSDTFFFDNEKPYHRVFLNSFEISSLPVTNWEFLEFMENGGYSKFHLWLSDGWDFISRNSISKPLYWHKINNEWYEYTLAGLKKLDIHSPLSHISFYEAEAFAQWKSLRLPTEFEWEIAARKYEPEISASSHFLDNFIFRPVINSQKSFFGSNWEWTMSSYLPYPGYRKDEGVLGEYNGKFMINQMVLKGGSAATPYEHIRHSYRNFFQPEKRWLFNGFRLAK